MTFWQRLAKKKKPFLALAPMEDVTDVVFRQVVEEVAPPDVFFTEFANVDGIIHFVSTSPLSFPSPNLGEGVGGEVLNRLVYRKTKTPTVAQIWGTDPESFYKAAQYVSTLEFDGLDINMGCPDKAVVKGGCGIALIRDRNKVCEIIQATRKGAGHLPLSVKTRIGWDKIVTEDWCGFLLEQKLDALTIHGRTGKEMSDGPAHWDEIAKVVKMNKTNTVIIGNGDVKQAQDAGSRAQETGVDGVMIGRGVFENINCFGTRYSVFGIQERIKTLKRHIQLWQETWGDKKNFSVLKKYFKIYIRDFEGASELRAKLMSAKNIKEILTFL